MIKWSITLAGSKTFVSLEDAFWDGMYEIAASEKMTTSALIEKIDSSRNNHNVSSAWFRESDLGFSQDEGYYTLEGTRIWVNEVNVEEAGGMVLIFGL